MPNGSMHSNELTDADSDSVADFVAVNLSTPDAVSESVPELPPIVSTDHESDCAAHAASDDDAHAASNSEANATSDTVPFLCTNTASDPRADAAPHNTSDSAAYAVANGTTEV